MTKNYTFISLLALIGCMMMASCGKKAAKDAKDSEIQIIPKTPKDFLDAKKTKTGILYKFISHNEDTSKAFRPDKAIDFRLTLKNYKDSVIKKQLIENIMYQPPRFKGDPGEILAKCAEGDSVLFAISIDSLVNMRATNPTKMFPSGSYMQYYVKVVKVKPAEEAKKALDEQRKIRDSLIRKRRDSLAKVQIEVDRQDSIKIREYVKENNLADKAKFTKSGLCYIITKEGDGPMPQAFDSVSTHYVGRLLNGNLFDTSVEEVALKENKHNKNRKYGPPFEFVLGARMVIPAWDEGLALLKKGGKATLIAPSKLAYGPQQRGKDIPANSILMFDVELVDVKKGKAPQPMPVPKGDGHSDHKE